VTAPATVPFAKRPRFSRSSARTIASHDGRGRWRRSTTARASTGAGIAGGRPSGTPFLRAWAIPAMTLWRFEWRWNSASAASSVKCMRPSGELVSISSSRTKKCPPPCRIWSTFMSISRTSRPSRSSACTTRTSAVALKQIISIAAFSPGPVSAPEHRSEKVAATVHPFRRATSRRSEIWRGPLASCDRWLVETRERSTARSRGGLRFLGRLARMRGSLYFAPRRFTDRAIALGEVDR
jgi:hypothetical protein